MTDSNIVLRNIGRWILVLPIAIAAYVVMSLLIGISSEIAGSELGNWPGASQELKNFLSQLGNSIAAPVALVYVGARMAPSHAFVVAVTLAAVHTAITLFVAVIGVANDVQTFLTDEYYLGSWWLLVSTLISIVAVAGTCWVVWDRTAN